MPTKLPAQPNGTAGAALPPDYLERVYAGVIGKVIGVYLGRPFEMWSHQRIMSELGPIRYYVNERLKVPLVVTDDDVSGTFTFVRALEEHGVSADLSSEAIGQTWLNQVVEKKSVFWWGGRGISTEHTAYLNLKRGVAAPASGSIAVNGRTVAEQIGAQIFIDGWALVSPGRPELAAAFARAAGSVSHDGESVHAAVVWAAMEAEAFVSADVDHLLDTGVGLIPADALIARVIADVRGWHKQDGGDWYATRQRIEDVYGYDKFGGNCHVVPNHAIMVMSLLYGGGSFSRAMEIVNTSGWDTDCNSGNVACLLAIMHGLDGFADGGPDWRGPIADRVLISSADNGYSINTAARIALDIASVGRQLAGKAPLPPPKDGAQFHFCLPGSVQGFRARDGAAARVAQAADAHGPALRIDVLDGAAEAEVTTPTCAPKELLDMPPVYPLMSSPLVYPGQTVIAVVRAGAELAAPVSVKLRLRHFDSADDLVALDGEAVTLRPGEARTLTWTVPEIPESFPIAELGLAIAGGAGPVWLDRLGWTGTPRLTLARPVSRPHTFWDLAWVQGTDDWKPFPCATVYIGQDAGEGIVSYGTREWEDYAVVVHDFSVKLGAPAGVAARVQGLRRYYALEFAAGGRLTIVKALDDKRIELAAVPFEWEVDTLYKVRLEVEGGAIRGSVNGTTVEAVDGQYKGGAMGFVVTDGALSTGRIEIGPVA